MAPPYNTIPAAADEQDSLLAKKDTTKLKRLVAGAAGGAAVASLLLGVLAATALKMPAGAAQTMLNGPDPLCNDKTAHADWSDLSNKLNDAMKGDGFIFRFRYDYQVPCDETHYNGKEKGLEKICGDEACKNGKCGVSATLLSNQAKTENPV